MAQAAFNLRRPAEIRSCSVLPLRELIVGIVAPDAGFKALPGRGLLPGVGAGGDLIGHICMADRALFGLKKIRYGSIDIDRVRMDWFPADAAVAFLTGQSAVNGNVISFLVNEPRSISGGRQPQQGTDGNCRNYEMFPERHLNKRPGFSLPQWGDKDCEFTSSVKVSGFGCQVSATEYEPIGRNRSQNRFFSTVVGQQSNLINVHSSAFRTWYSLTPETIIRPSFHYSSAPQSSLLPGQVQGPFFNIPGGINDGF